MTNKHVSLPLQVFSHVACSFKKSLVGHIMKFSPITTRSQYRQHLLFSLTPPLCCYPQEMVRYWCRMVEWIHTTTQVTNLKPYWKKINWLRMEMLVWPSDSAWVNFKRVCAPALSQWHHHKSVESPASNSNIISSWGRIFCSYGDQNRSAE